MREAEAEGEVRPRVRHVDRPQDVVLDAVVVALQVHLGERVELPVILTHPDDLGHVVAVLDIQFFWLDSDDVTKAARDETVNVVDAERRALAILKVNLGASRDVLGSKVKGPKVTTAEVRHQVLVEVQSLSTSGRSHVQHQPLL